MNKRRFRKGQIDEFHRGFNGCDFRFIKTFWLLCSWGNRCVNRHVRPCWIIRFNQLSVLLTYDINKDHLMKSIDFEDGLFRFIQHVEQRNSDYYV